MTHVPSITLDDALSIRFPGGGGLDLTTAILCCSVKSPVVIQSIEAECDQVRVQWYRLITQMQRTPAIKMELTSLRCEYMQQTAATYDPSSPSKKWFFSPSKTFPSPISSSRSTAQPRLSSSTSPRDPSAFIPFKISALCDGKMQVFSPPRSCSSNTCVTPFIAYTCTRHSSRRSTTASAEIGTVLLSPLLQM